jgi:hypothetical protein
VSEDQRAETNEENNYSIIKNTIDKDKSNSEIIINNVKGINDNYEKCKNL